MDSDKRKSNGVTRRNWRRAYIPGVWKAINDEDPAFGIPTTYYTSVHLTCQATIVLGDESKKEILRKQLNQLDNPTELVDPDEHEKWLSGIQGLRLRIENARSKFKYGGNVDADHRIYIAEKLAQRNQPGDKAARQHLLQ